MILFRRECLSNFCSRRSAAKVDGPLGAANNEAVAHARRKKSSSLFEVASGRLSDLVSIMTLRQNRWLWSQ